MDGSTIKSKKHWRNIYNEKTELCFVRHCSIIFILGSLITANFANADENLNTKLYYNDEYSFSIEYPDGWKVKDSGNFIDDGVTFFDGSEESILFGMDLWNTGILLQYSPDYVKKSKETVTIF